MTIAPEQKAKDIADRIFQSGSRWGEHDWEFAEEIIASAIREAENAALERAQRELAMTIMANIDEGEPEFINGLSIARDRIETLKRPKD